LNDNHRSFSTPDIAHYDKHDHANENDTRSKHVDATA